MVDDNLNIIVTEGSGDFDNDIFDLDSIKDRLCMELNPIGTKEHGETNNFS